MNIYRDTSVVGGWAGCCFVVPRRRAGGGGRGGEDGGDVEARCAKPVLDCERGILRFGLDDTAEGNATPTDIGRALRRLLLPLGGDS